MTRTLILMRHAKAAGAATDYERPLSDYGREVARAQGSAMLRALGAGVDLALVSAATRARQTFEALHFGGLEVGEVRFEQELYLDSGVQARDLIRTVDDSVETLLVLFHQPSVSELAYNLTLPQDEAGLSGGFSAGTFVVGIVDTAWAELTNWHLSGHYPPTM